MNLSAHLRDRLLRELALQDEFLDPRTLRLAAAERMAILELKDESSYWEQAADSDVELAALRDGCLVAETGFFRDETPFSLLPCWAQARRHSGETLRILSAPCSTGEEPYSIAIALLESGWKEDSFVIDAVDISRTVLHAAQRGLYPTRRVQPLRTDRKERFLQRSGASWQVRPEVQRHVRFHERNLTQPNFSAPAAPYDAVFCRNLLVYLTEAGRHQLQANLLQSLASDGLLIVGHAEAAQIGRHPAWVSMPPPGAFAFVRRGAVPAESLAIGTAKSAPSPTPEISLPSKTRHREPSDPTTARLSQDTAATALLDRVEALADAGRLSEAGALCAEWIGQHPSNSRAHYLLGLIRSADGHPTEARQLFATALRLDPHNHDARLHLAAESAAPKKPSPLPTGPGLVPPGKRSATPHRS